MAARVQPRRRQARVAAIQYSLPSRPRVEAEAALQGSAARTAVRGAALLILEGCREQELLGKATMAAQGTAPAPELPVVAAVNRRLAAMAERPPEVLEVRASHLPSPARALGTRVAAAVQPETEALGVPALKAAEMVPWVTRRQPRAVLPTRVAAVAALLPHTPPQAVVVRESSWCVGQQRMLLLLRPLAAQAIQSLAATTPTHGPPLEASRYERDDRCP